MRQPVVAIDLFCGAGGLSRGLQDGGVRVVAGIDVDPACRYPYEANIGADFREEDVTGLSAESVETLFPAEGVRVLAGCTPCQPFSTYTRTRAERKGEWELLAKFGELVASIKPEIVTMENVPRLERHQSFSDYVGVLEEAGYHCSFEKVRCIEYGIPQMRERLVLLASTLGVIELLSPEEPTAVTVRDAIGHLSPITAGESSADDAVHKASTLASQNMKRIRSSRPGGTWRDWEPDLRAPCHRKQSGQTYPGVYGRMEWDAPAPTITTQFHGYGNGRFGHPEQDRAISLREGALLQTFPEEYAFAPEGASVPVSTVARMIGNAVPVKLGEVIGRSIMAHLENVRRD